MKAKKVILSLLVACPLMFTACSDENGNTSGNNGDVVVPGADRSIPTVKPNAFFNGLKRSENMLHQNFWFTSQIDGDNITYTDLSKIFQGGRTSFEMLAERKGMSVGAVKIAFYDDIYAFAQNHQNLVIREAELKAHSPKLYKEYFAKTLSLGNIFTPKRAQIYSRSLELNEEQLFRVGIQSFDVISQGVLDISITGVDSTQISKKPMQRIVKTIKRAQKTCSALTTMLNDPTFKDSISELNIRDCGSSSAVQAVSQLRSVDSLSRSQIISQLNASSVMTIEALNDVADSYLAANAIVLRANRNRGIREGLRNKWERQIIRDNPRQRRDHIEVALDNNLYENLLFKRNVVHTLVKIKPSMTHEQRSTTSDELKALRKALRDLRDIGVNLKVGSSAISNGIENLPTPDVIIAPDVTPSPRQRATPDVISEPEIDSIVADSDDLGGFDDVSKPETSAPTPPPVQEPSPVVVDEDDKKDAPGPPTPPTSVRRN